MFLEKTILFNPLPFLRYGVVFFIHFAYNKNVIIIHRNTYKNVGAYIHGTIDFE